LHEKAHHIIRLAVITSEYINWSGPKNLHTHTVTQSTLFT